ncbi:MAG TPA: AAA family ATPase [Candidatus Dormibacteraeota bacterium]|nr:AAA family ATPase [Candidatus Dormibacteraeota bacterium]
MRLVRLRVRGFRRFRDLDLDLDHPRLLVLGANEAGKTTLLDALLAGLYGLDPVRGGRGHPAALREATPWDGGGAGLSLSLRLSDGPLIEVDWDLTGERTRVVDHGSGENISPDFATGTHGWRDVGGTLLGLPGSVFRQPTCVGEGELARIAEPAEIRNSLLRIAESGVDEMVEAALRRLDEGALQASVPRVNARTRRNLLGQELRGAEAELERVAAERAALDGEVGAIAEIEARLAGADAAVVDLRVRAEAERVEVERLAREEAERSAEAARRAVEAERQAAAAERAASERALLAARRAAARAQAVATAESLRVRVSRLEEAVREVDAEAAALRAEEAALGLDAEPAPLPADEAKGPADAEPAGEGTPEAGAEAAPAPASPLPWTSAEMDEARRLLASPPPAEPAPPQVSIPGLTLAGLGVVALAAGIQLRQGLALAAGLLLALAGVILLTRRPIRTPEPVVVAGRAFPDRAAVMLELDRQRSRAQTAERRAARAGRRRALEERRARLDALLEGRPLDQWRADATAALAAVPDADAGAEAEAGAGPGEVSTPDADDFEPHAPVAVQDAVAAAVPGAAAAGAPLAETAASATADPLTAAAPATAGPLTAAVPATAGAQTTAASEADAASATATLLAAAEREAAGLRDERLERRASLERGARQVPEIAPLEERVADLRERIAALEEFGAACSLAADTLRRESTALRRAYAPRLQSILSRDLARVTDARYREAIVSDDFRIHLRAPETAALVELERLSRGTQQQVYLLLRLALLEIVGSASEPLPLFLDDALALSDDRRRGELLAVIAEQPRQVVYLTAGATAADAFGPEWRRVELPAPDGSAAQAALPGLG